MLVLVHSPCVMGLARGGPGNSGNGLDEGRAGKRNSRGVFSGSHTCVAFPAILAAYGPRGAARDTMIGGTSQTTASNLSRAAIEPHVMPHTGKIRCRAKLLGVC